MTTGKIIALTRWTCVGKVMSLLFNMLSMLVITVLPKSRHLLISWLQSPSAMILEPKKIKSVTVSVVSPSVCHEVIGPDAMILVFWMLSQLFHSPLSLSSRGSLVLLCFLPKGWCHLHIWGYLWHIGYWNLINHGLVLRLDQLICRIFSLSNLENTNQDISCSRSNVK